MAVLSPRNPKPILIKSLLWFGGGLLLLVLIVVASLHVQRASAEAALAEKLTELEAAGLPTTLEEIHRRYHDHNRGKRSTSTCSVCGLGLVNSWNGQP